MLIELLALKELNKNPILPQPTPTTSVLVETKKKQTKPKPIIYKVKSGDSLTTISKARRVSVSRLWSANKQLDHPDIIHVGQRLRIPRAGDKLKKRAMIKNVIGGSSLSIAPTNKPSQSGGFSSSGNSYEPGQCVWFIKNMRPEIPNSWGSAGSWLASAQAQGWPTGSTPRVGAVGWTPGHVVLITAVNKDGTVDITDMNGRWTPYEIGYGTYSSGKYQYIY